MITRTTVIRGLLGLGTSTVLALGTAAGLASTAEAAAPSSVTVTATPTYGGASIAVVVPLAVKDIAGASCTLDAAAVGCGTPVAVTKGSTRYSSTLAGLTGGAHTFTMTVTKASKTDRKAATTLTGSAVFQPVADPQTTCEGVGGTLTWTGADWECDLSYDLATVTDQLVSSDRAKLATACPAAMSAQESILLLTQKDVWQYFC